MRDPSRLRPLRFRCRCCRVIRKPPHIPLAGSMRVGGLIHVARIQTPRRDTRPPLRVRLSLAGFLAVSVAAVEVDTDSGVAGAARPAGGHRSPVLDRHQGQGVVSRDITRNPSSAGLWIPEAAAYVGMRLGILAACLAPFHDSRRYAFFLIGLAIAAGGDRLWDSTCPLACGPPSDYQGHEKRPAQSGDGLRDGRAGRTWDFNHAARRSKNSRVECSTLHWRSSA